MMLSHADPVRVLLLAIFIALAMPSLLGECPTWDEPYHLTQGFRFLKTGDPSLFNEVSPPGYQAIAALPLVLAGVPLAPLPAENPASRTAVFRLIREFLAAGSARVLRLFPLARLAVLAMTVVLGWILYDVAARAWGRNAGRLALLLFVFDPNLLAHGKLVTTDAGITFGMFLVLTALARWARSPHPGRAGALGLLLGWALVGKHSAIILVTWLIPLGAILVAGRRPAVSSWVVFRDSVIVFGSALALIWAVHGFAVGSIRELRDHAGRVPFRRPTPDDVSDLSLRSRQPWAQTLEGWTIPAPGYVQGVIQTMRHAYERGHPAYLRGDYRRDGWVEYFPIAFAIKTPLPTLLLLLATLASFLLVRPAREEWMWLAFVAIYFATAMRSSLNIGYRHLLPILPPIFLLCGRLVGEPVRQRVTRAWRNRGRLALATVLLWLVVGTVRTHRHPLAYFNEIVGGGENGWKYLVDASLDWGQDLPGLAKWLRDHDVGLVRLSYYGTVDPALYGIPWLPIQLPMHPDGHKPTPDEIPAGVYAVSVSNMVESQSLGRGPLTVFEGLSPVASIGHSIRIFVVDGNGGASSSGTPAPAREGERS